MSALLRPKASGGGRNRGIPRDAAGKQSGPAPAARNKARIQHRVFKGVSPSKQNSVRVMARFRPINAMEERHGTTNVKEHLTFSEDRRSLKMGAIVNEAASAETAVAHSGTKGGTNTQHVFSFDRIFPPSTSQEVMFDECAKHVVDDLLLGFNGTIFAYGQTGSGKTYSMFGTEDNEGIIPRAVNYMFENLRSKADVAEVTIKVGFLEIYNEAIRDLLNPKNTRLSTRERPDGSVYCEGLLEEYVTSVEDVMQCISMGEQSRTTASTDMNEQSSRSHSVVIVTLSQRLKDGGLVISKLNLADLAGSERVGKTNAQGNTLKEAQGINKSLSLLGRCIKTLTTRGARKQHVPYRDSKLTFLLKDSLGGNTKTTLLVTCSPHAFNAEETLSTLRFAQRAKEIKNAAKVNKQLSVEELQRMVDSLKRLLAKRDARIEELEKTLFDADMQGVDRSGLSRALAEMAADGLSDDEEENAAKDEQKEAAGQEQRDRQFSQVEGPDGAAAAAEEKEKATETGGGPSVVSASDPNASALVEALEQRQALETQIADLTKAFEEKSRTLEAQALEVAALKSAEAKHKVHTSQMHSILRHVNMLEDMLSKTLEINSEFQFVLAELMGRQCTTADCDHQFCWLLKDEDADDNSDAAFEDDDEQPGAGGDDDDDDMYDMPSMSVSDENVESKSPTPSISKPASAAAAAAAAESAGTPGKCAAPDCNENVFKDKLHCVRHLNLVHPPSDLSTQLMSTLRARLEVDKLQDENMRLQQENRQLKEELRALKSKYEGPQGSAPQVDRAQGPRFVKPAFRPTAEAVSTKLIPRQSQTNSFLRKALRGIISADKTDTGRDALLKAGEQSVICEGYVFKRAQFTRSWNRRYMVLRSWTGQVETEEKEMKTVMQCWMDNYNDRKEARSGSTQPRGHLVIEADSMAEMEVYHIGKDDVAGFVIRIGNKSVSCYPDTDDAHSDTQEVWVQKINELAGALRSAQAASLPQLEKQVHKRGSTFGAMFKQASSPTNAGQGGRGFADVPTRTPAQSITGLLDGLTDKK